MYGYSIQPRVYEDLSRYNIDNRRILPAQNSSGIASVFLNTTFIKVPAMADGLSTAASVIAVIQMATSLAGVGYKYLSGAKRAPECLRRLTAELKTLIEILTEIHIRAQDPESKLQGLDSSLQQCFADMIKLQDKLRPRNNSGLWGSIRTRLQWPFEESDIMDHLVRMERFKSTFTLAMGLNQQ